MTQIFPTLQCRSTHSHHKWGCYWLEANETLGRPRNQVFRLSQAFNHSFGLANGLLMVTQICVLLKCGPSPRQCHFPLRESSLRLHLAWFRCNLHFKKYSESIRYLCLPFENIIAHTNHQHFETTVKGVCKILFLRESFKNWDRKSHLDKPPLEPPECSEHPKWGKFLNNFVQLFAPIITISFHLLQDSV